MGLRFAIGHTQNLKKDDILKKMILTKSTIELNKLNDLLELGSRIHHKLILYNDPGYSWGLKSQWVEKSDTRLRRGSLRGEKHGDVNIRKFSSYSSNRKEAPKLLPATLASLEGGPKVKIIANVDDINNKDLKVNMENQFSQTINYFKKVTMCNNLRAGADGRGAGMEGVCMLAKSIAGKDNTSILTEEECNTPVYTLSPSTAAFHSAKR